MGKKFFNPLFFMVTGIALFWGIHPAPDAPSFSISGMRSEALAAEREQLPKSIKKPGQIGNGSVSGYVETSADGKIWNALEEGGFTVINCSFYRTSDGRISFVFPGNDMTMTLGEQSSLFIKGDRKDYSAELFTGKMSFIVHGQTKFVIKVPGLIIEAKKEGMERMVNMPDKNSISGGVYFDGKRTHIVAVSGQLILKTPSGKNMMTLTAGKTVTISPEISGKNPASARTADFSSDSTRSAK